MEGAVENPVGVFKCHKRALQHHCGAVGDAVHHVQVVGDQHIAQPQFGLQAAQQFQNFFGDQRIQRGGGFVQNDQVGLGREGPGNAHALLLAAGQLAGAARQKVARQFHQIEQLFSPLPDGGAVESEIKRSRTADDVEHALARVDGHIRNLVDQLDAAFEVFAALGQSFGKRLAFECNLATGGRQQAGDHPGQCGFAGAGFADHRDCLAHFHVQAHVVDDLEAAVGGIDLVDFQNGLVLHRGG